MKRVILLGAKDAGGKNDVRQLKDALAPQLHEAELRVVYLEDLLMIAATTEQQFVDTATNQDMKDADMVLAFNWYKGGPSSLYRDVAFALALYLEKHGVAFWNSEMRAQRSISKVSAMMQLALLGMPVPRTRFSLSTEALLRDTAAPFILKSATASRGADNYKCESADEARQYVDGKGPNHFLVQEYIPNDHDIRVVCVGGEPKLAIERRRRDVTTHLNNTSAGAEATLRTLDQLPANVIEECKRICYNMGREMAGIDLLPRQDKPAEYVYLEVNAIPQLTSGVFVNEKMAALAQALKEKKA